MIKTSGYSRTPLAKKLGIKPGFVVRLYNQPDYYFDLFTDMPGDIRFVSEKTGTKNLVHYFTRELSSLQDNIIELRAEIFPSGSLWISWPKKTAKTDTNVTEDLIRAIALKNSLVDIKVCAIDETWSGLKLVVPVKDRI